MNGQLTAVACCTAALLMAACATPVRTVALPLSGATAGSVDVRDGRLDKQLTMTSVAWDSTMSLALLETEPPLDRALAAALAPRVTSGHGITSVTLVELDLRNRTGFATADAITCKVRSTVFFGPQTQTVDTVTTNTDNRSPLVVDAAKAGLMQCLAAHAQQIADLRATR